MKDIKEFLINERKENMSIYYAYPNTNEDFTQKTIQLSNIDNDYVKGIAVDFTDNCVHIHFLSENDVDAPSEYKDKTFLGKDYDKFHNLKSNESFINSEGQWIYKK